jgi:hypothetical protein
VGSGGKRRCSSVGKPEHLPGRILDVGVNTTKEMPLPLSKSGPLQAPGHDQKKAGSCVIVRALIQAFFVGAEGGVEIGEKNPLRGSACPYCLRKTTDEDDNEVTVNF